MSLKFMEEGWPLQKFQVKPPCSPFDDAQGILPQFLVENLNDSNRIIKYFKSDTQASIRIFCFQYLKLCFQMEQADYETYIGKIQEILTNQNFRFLFPSDKDGSFYNQFQFKRLIIQFLEYIDNQQVSVDSAYKRYPIMDQVFVSLIRSILFAENKCQTFDQYIPKEDLFDFLSSYFAVDIALYESCLKFIDSDVFIYEDDPQQVYMIYIDYQKQNTESQKSDIIEEQPDSQMCISSVEQVQQAQQVFSNMNIEQDEYQQQKQKQDDNSAVYEQVDYTYSKNSDPTINREKLQKQSFKFSIHSSVSYDCGVENRPHLSSSIHGVKNIISQSPQLSSEHHSSTIHENFGINSDKLSRHKNCVSDICNNQNISKKSDSKPKLFERYSIQQYDDYSSKENSNIFHKSYDEKFIQNNLILKQRQFGVLLSNKDIENWNKENNSAGIKNFNALFTIESSSNKVEKKLNGYSEKNYLKNVSKQFTNSILLKQIIQPFSTNIYMMKARARAQRRALEISPLYHY